MALLVVLLPALLFANVYQAYRYSQLDHEITALESEQTRLLEENKRIILAIALLSSPDRIADIAENDLGLERIGTGDITRMTVPEFGGGR